MGDGGNVHNVITLETVLFGIVVLGIILAMFLRMLRQKESVKKEPEVNIKHIRIRVHMIGSQSYIFESASPYIGVQIVDYAGTDMIEGSKAERARIKRELLEKIEIGKTYDATFTRTPCDWRITELKEPAEEKTSDIVFEA